jgi:hypothetical protein
MNNLDNLQAPDAAANAADVLAAIAAFLKFAHVLHSAD